jgi:glucose-6-phosphate 1-dehydrogenase
LVKITLEKPFGTDLITAQKLNQQISLNFSPSEVYRIDHFLAKETVQNILVFRFANGMFENLWNNQFVDHVQIRTIENRGVDGRSEFYDSTGTIRDVVQNHALQMLAITLMEEPFSLSADSIRTKRLDILNKIALADTQNPFNSVVFGQYTDGVVDGLPVKSYLKEQGIPKSSRTETAAALKLFVHNQRWSGVPIYIKAGKRLDRTATEISIHFKEKSNRMFSQLKLIQSPNIITFRIDPKESVTLRLSVKRPGLDLAFHDVPLQFSYRKGFQTELIEAYVKLIYDAIQNDPTLFADAQDIEAAWRVIDPILNPQDKKRIMHHYAAGTRGPQAFNDFIAADHRQWIIPS